MRSNERKIEFNVNAYDADAGCFCFYFSKQRNCIYIMDNGVGMKEATLRENWMMIGNSSKKVNYLSQGNRIQTGAKGIGRFALD